MQIYDFFNMVFLSYHTSEFILNPNRTNKFKRMYSVYEKRTNH